MIQPVKIVIPPEKLAAALAKHFTKPLLNALESGKLTLKKEA